MLRAISVLLVGVSVALQAQTTDTTIRAPEDSVIQRARQLVNEGRAADGRRLIDSLLKVAPEGERYAEALYWRAALATTASDAERDYRRLLIEAPLSARAEDALLQLAQLEQARGDRQEATEHLQRFMLTYARNPERPRVAIWLVRLLFEQVGGPGAGPLQLTRACEALRSGRDEIPAENAELRNQLEFYAPRCTGEVAVVTPPTPTDSQPAPPPAVATRPAPKPARDSTRREPVAARPSVTKGATKTAAKTPTKTSPAKSPVTKAPTAKTSTAKTPPAKTPAKAPTEFFSVQIAAYDSAEPATRLMKLLVSRGIDARVDGKARPFRVRVGKYATRAQATKAAATLKSQGHGGFVTLVKAGSD